MSLMYEGNRERNTEHLSVSITHGRGGVKLIHLYEN